MKIVRLIARLNVGGPARHVVWLTKELNDGEFESVLIAGAVPGGEEDMRWFATENAVEPVFISAMSRELSAQDILSLWKVYRQIVREKPAIIHTHTAKAGTIGRLAGFLYRWLNWKRVRLVHTFHGHIFRGYYGSRKTAVFLLIEKLLARLATDRIIVISDLQFQDIHKRFGVGKKEQFSVIPLGIDLKKFADSSGKRDVLRTEIGADEDEILIGLVGRLTEIKNVALLLKVAQIYRQQKESAALPKLRFVIIGGGHLRAALEKETEQCGLRETVVFLGNRNDADVFYAGLDLIALTSISEGTPLSLIEAMAAEKPLIATTVGGVADLLGEIKNENDGFQIRERGIGVCPNSAESFYSGLIYLAKNEKLQKSLIAAGKTFVTARYAKERLTKDLKNLYRDLMRD